MKDMFIFVGWLRVGVDSEIVSEEEEGGKKKTFYSLDLRIKNFYNKDFQNDF